MINTLKSSLSLKHFAVPILLVIIFFLYLPSLSNGFFCWDDHEVALSPIIQHLSVSQIGIFFTKYHAGLYHPLTTLSFAIDYYMGHGSALPYHITNLLFHLANTCLIYLLIKRLTTNPFIPLLIALLSGIHPMHVESVAWITARKDLLYSFFLLISLLLYISYIRNKEKKSLYFSLSLLCALLSALSKIQATVLPFLLLLIDYLFDRKILSRKVILEKIPFFIIMILLIIVNIYAQKDYGYTGFKEDYSVWQRIILFCNGFLFYLFKIIIPYPVSIFYPFPFSPSDHFSIMLLLYPIGFLLFLFGTLWLILKSYREPVFGLLFFSLNIFLVLLINNFREFFIADRYTYIASTGIFLFLSSLCIKLFNKKPDLKWFIISFGLLYLLGCSLVTYNEIKLWHSPLKLFTRALDHYPQNPIILTTLGSIASDSGMYNEAIGYLDMALSVDKSNVYTYYNKAVAESKLQRYDLALREFNTAISLNPNYLNAYFGRGNVYRITGRFRQALDDYSYILNKDGSNFGAWNNRAIVKGNLGDFQGSLDDLNHAISLNPKSGPSYYLRGIAKFETGINGCDDLNTALSLNYEGARKAIDYYCKIIKVGRSSTLHHKIK